MWALNLTLYVVIEPELLTDSIKIVLYSRREHARAETPLIAQYTTRWKLETELAGAYCPYYL